MKLRIVRYTSLAVVAIVMAWIWLVLLPRIAEIPAVTQRIEKLRTAGINPTAVFYTDHPGMKEIEQSVAADVHVPDSPFWKWSISRQGIR